MTRQSVALVTGGAGFIGSHMVENLLGHGYAVRVVDNLTGGRESNLEHMQKESALSFEQLDIRKLEPGSPIFSDVQYVFHFAGIGDIVPSIERPAEYISVNVQGTVSVLEAARHANVKKFVYAASSSCYGIADTPTKESHVIDPMYPYALSKYQGEVAAFHWQKVYGLPVNSIRIFNAYGPRVRTTGAYGAVFGVFFRQKIGGEPFTVVGDGTQTRDFVFVTDVAEAFFLAGKTDKANEIWNLGGGDPQSILRLVGLIGGDIVHIPKRPGEPDCTYADITKISRDLNWKPKVSFEDGIAIMMSDIEKWKDAPLWTPDSIADATRVWFAHMGES